MPQVTDSVFLDLVTNVGIVTAQQSMLLSEQGEAKEGRKNIAEKLDHLSDRVHNLEAMSARVAEMAPHVSELMALKNKVAGGVLVVMFIGSALFVGVGFVLKEGWSWLAAHLSWR